MSPRPDSREIALLLHLLGEGYDRKAWHGPNLRGAIRGLSPADAAWRPARGRHNTRELVVHAAYWKYAVARALTGGKRGGFPLSGSNWFARETEGSWREDVALLDAMHAKLCDAVAAFPPAQLHRPVRGSGHTAVKMIAGVAAHDLYHAGQIRLMKVLKRRTRGR